MRILIFCCLCFLVCCNINKKSNVRNVERSFYYWKSVFKLSVEEKKALTNLKIETLYIKYFDVDWEDAGNRALPIAQLKVVDSIFLKTSKITIVPTVFITNETIFKINISQTEELANKILLLVKNISNNIGVNTIKEIQIDCDWTASTKEKYFSLLTFLQAKEKGINFSATIRLHQIKYSNKTGIPPVTRGMLMCYNMGNVSNAQTKNSILEISEMEKYIGYLKNYSLPLDVALPIFEWKVIFRNNVFKGLVENFSDSLLVSDIFEKNGNIYSALKDTLLQGYEVKQHDVWRSEETNYKDVLKAASLLNTKLAGKKIRVSLYHLDKLALRKYSNYEMENIYNALH